MMMIMAALRLADWLGAGRREEPYERGRAS